MDRVIEEKKQFHVILWIVFFGFLGISMPYLTFPPLLLNSNFGFLPEHFSQASRMFFLGLTLAVYPLGQFLGAPILGSLSDTYGRKRLISGSLIIAAIAYAITGLALAHQNLSLVIMSRFLAGLMEGNIAIARAASIDLKTISKHATLGKVNASASVAYLIGPILGAAFADQKMIQKVTIATPFYWISVLFVLLAFLAWKMLKIAPQPSNKAQPSIGARFNLFQRMRVLFKHRSLKFLLIVSTIFTLGVDIFYEFGPVYLTAKWSLIPSQLILYNAFLCIGLFVGNGWLPKFLSKHYLDRKTLLWAMMGFGIFLLIIVCVFSPWIMTVLFTLSGLAIGVGATLLTVKISDVAPVEIQGEVMGTQLSLRVLGDGLICLLGGVLCIFSPAIILAIAAAVSIIMALSCYRQYVSYVTMP